MWAKSMKVKFRLLKKELSIKAVVEECISGYKSGRINECERASPRPQFYKKIPTPTSKFVSNFADEKHLF